MKTRTRLQNNKQLVAVFIVLLAGLSLVWAVMRNAKPAPQVSDEGGHGGQPTSEIVKGPHGGRLLSDAD